MTSFSVTGFPSSTTAGVAASFTVIAKDAYGNTVTGYTGQVRFSSTDVQAGLPANYTFSASDAGVHTFNATLKTAGLQSLTVTDTLVSTLTGSESNISVQAAAATHFRVTAPTNAQVGVAFNVTVTAIDAYGNVATGYTGTVHFTSNDGRAILPANYTFTGADAGVHVFSVTLRSHGTQNITVTDILTGSVNGRTSVSA